MPQILIAGCGYVGQATADMFHAAGWPVEGWTHSAQSGARLSAKPYPVYAVDIANKAQVGARAGPFDAIIQGASTGGGDADACYRIASGGAAYPVDRVGGTQRLFTRRPRGYA